MLDLFSKSRKCTHSGAFNLAYLYTYLTHGLPREVEQQATLFHNSILCETAGVRPNLFISENGWIPYAPAVHSVGFFVL